MSALDIILIFLGVVAGVGAFLTGSDALYKLFLGLIIGFLMYQVVAGQAEIMRLTVIENYDGYQKFLSQYDTSLLGAMLILIPLLGVVFMLNSRLSFATKEKSISQILLGLLLPVFLVGILANLAQGSILSESETWKKVFSFFEKSGIYQIFEKLPWGIFLLLTFLVLYKSLFLILIAFGKWLYHEVFLQFFKTWSDEKKLIKKSSPLGDEDEDSSD